jgi:hypothetical protein
MTGRRGRLDRVQHAMARERVFEGGAQMRSLAIVAGETRVRLGDVGGRTRALRRRPPILLWHGQDLAREMELMLKLPTITVVVVTLTCIVYFRRNSLL